MAENLNTLRVVGFKTTYDNLPKRGTDPLNDVTDAQGFLVDQSGRRVMEIQREDWVIYAPSHSPLNTKNTERVRHMIPNPDRIGSDPDGVKMAFMSARWSQIEAAYDAWLKGQEIPVNGMPLSAWPGINSDQVEIFRQVGLRTVEEVRDLSEGQLEKVRLPNMRDLRTQARLFLENVGAADIAKREADRDLEVQTLREQLAELRSLIPATSAKSDAPAEPADDEVAGLRAQLDAAGIDYDGRWGAPKLRSMLPKVAA